MEYRFIENLKLILEENQIMKQTGFIIDQWSFHIDSMPFTLQAMIFRYSYNKSNDELYTSNSLTDWKGLTKFTPRECLNSTLISIFCLYPSCSTYSFEK